MALTNSQKEKLVSMLHDGMRMIHFVKYSYGVDKNCTFCLDGAEIPLEDVNKFSGELMDLVEARDRRCQCGGSMERVVIGPLMIPAREKCSSCSKVEGVYLGAWRQLKEKEESNE